MNHWRKTLVLGGICLLAIATGVGWKLWSKFNPPFVAQSSILLAGGLKIPDDEWMDAQIVALQSREVVACAIQNQKLEKLESLVDSADPASTVAGMISVVRDRDKDNGRPNNVLLIEYRGHVEADCKSILAALIESYREILDNEFSDIDRMALDEIEQRRKTLEVDLGGFANKVKFRKLPELQRPQVYVLTPPTVSNRRLWR